MTTTPAEESTTIKHLVISSGGPAGHMMYSILRTLNLKGLWDIKDIKSIYGSSIGTYIAIILSLRYDWHVLDDYLVKRPWEKIFTRGSVSSSSGNGGSSGSSGSGNTNDADNSASSTFVDAKNKIEYILRLYNHHGLYGLKEFTEMLRPALQGKDISVNVTLREFYEKTGVELHFIVTEINKFCVVDFNYKTHPNQSLIEASYMSCCYPFGFTPIYRDGCCYLDGGIINDYPVNECIRDQKCNLSEILGVKMLWERKPANLTDKSSVLQFVSTFFSQINSNFFENRVTRAIPNEVVCVSKLFSAQDWINWIKDENYRRELVLRGETFANVFLSYRRNFHETRLFEQSPHSPLPELDATAAVQNVILDTSASASELALDIIHTGDEYDINEAETTDHDIIASTPNTTSFELHNNDETTMV